MNKKLIIYNLIDCGIAFAIAFLTAVLLLGEITLKGILISLGSATLVGLIKFRDFYSKQVENLNAKNNKKIVQISSIFF